MKRYGEVTGAFGESRVGRFSRVTMNIWIGLSLFSLFGLLISLPGPGGFSNMVSVLWWQTSSGVVSLSFALTASIILFGSAALLARGVWRSRLVAASALAFTIAGYTQGTSSATTTTGYLFELAFINGPLGLGLIWLIAPSRLRKAGHCPRCGYHLKGVDSNRCPECGEPIRAWVDRY